MNRKIMLIGSDSFIAGNFIKACGDDYRIRGASPVSTRLEDELVLDDMFQLSAGDFEGVDSVINFAAIVHRPEISDSRLYERVNHQLPVHLAAAAKEAGAEHFIQMSTVAVYGPVERISRPTPTAPDNLYGESKLRADRALMEMEQNSFRVSIVRPSMVYGGRAAPGNMMKLIKLCDSPLPMPFRGIQNGRQFAYIGLLTEALNSMVSRGAGGVFLVADREPVSTPRLIRIIRSALGRPEKQFRVPGPARLVLEKCRPSLYRKLFGSLIIDVEDTYRELGLAGSEHHMEKGIEEMVGWYRRCQRS